MGLRILMHHRFPAVQQQALEAQCAHICRYYRPLSLTQIGDCLRTGQKFPRNSVAVTVDDGYRDFFEFGYPVFRRFGIPVTVYLVTDFLDRKDWLWMDRIKYAIAFAQVEELETTLGGETLKLPLHSQADRDRASQTLREKCKRVRHNELLKFIDYLPQLTRVRFPAEPPAEMRPMRWDEVRKMDGKGVEFGAHTRSHPILSNLSGTAEIEAEIAGSRRRIEAELNHPVDHFCYPSGQPADVSEAAMRCVRSAGFATAVTSEIGLAQPGDNPLLLRRIGVDPGIPHHYFHELLAGFGPTLRPACRTLSFETKVKAAVANAS